MDTPFKGEVGGKNYRNHFTLKITGLNLILNHEKNISFLGTGTWNESWFVVRIELEPGVGP